MPALAVPAAMKKKHGQKNVSFRTAMSSANGTPKTSAPNFGTYLTAACTTVKTSGYSPFQTGPS